MLPNSSDDEGQHVWGLGLKRLRVGGPAFRLSTAQSPSQSFATLYYPKPPVANSEHLHGVDESSASSTASGFLCNALLFANTQGATQPEGTYEQPPDSQPSFRSPISPLLRVFSTSSQQNGQQEQPPTGGCEADSDEAYSIPPQMPRMAIVPVALPSGPQPLSPHPSLLYLYRGEQKARDGEYDDNLAADAGGDEVPLRPPTSGLGATHGEDVEAESAGSRATHATLDDLPSEKAVCIVRSSTANVSAKLMMEALLRGDASSQYSLSDVVCPLATATRSFHPLGSVYKFTSEDFTHNRNSSKNEKLFIIGLVSNQTSGNLVLPVLTNVIDRVSDWHKLNGRVSKPNIVSAGLALDITVPLRGPAGDSLCIRLVQRTVGSINSRSTIALNTDPSQRKRKYPAKPNADQSTALKPKLILTYDHKESPRRQNICVNEFYFQIPNTKIECYFLHEMKVVIGKVGQFRIL